jgi:cyclophilin family peptidyl-prolyl cis-trans isomerase
MGTFCIELFRDEAPAHVDNFLFYLRNDLLVGTFFHRSIPGFVLQGAGFRVGALDYEAVPPDNGPVTNEPCTLDTPVDPGDPGGTQMCSERGNERGTVALAKLAGDENSGTTGWFINLADNRANLDNQNGGFTVFGRVISDGMAVVDAIAGLTLATPDDLAWLQTILQDSPIPLIEPPLDDAFGCFDPSQQATVLDLSTLPDLTAALDPVITPSFPFTVSAPCGTPTTFEGFVANPGPPSCPDLDRLTARTTGPVTLLFPGGDPSWFALTCEETQEALAQRALWLSAYEAHLDSNLVFIEFANEQRVTSPVPAVSPLGNALLAGLILVAGCWMLWRRSPEDAGQPQRRKRPRVPALRTPRLRLISRVGSCETWTRSLPKFRPSRSPMKARGAFSRPSTTSSRYLSFPLRIQVETFTRKSSCRSMKSPTKRPWTAGLLASTRFSRPGTVRS